MMSAKDTMLVSRWIFICVLFFGVVNTQAVNQTFGRRSGERVLHQIANMSSKSALECCKECTNLINMCNAVAYNKATNECELNNKNVMYNYIRDSRWNSYHTLIEENQCEEGWVLYDMHCYHFLPLKKSWGHQNNTCEDMESHLVSIDSVAENDWVINRAIEEGLNDKIWIGMNDIIAVGTFEWTSGDEVTTRLFRYGEPNGGSNENCVHMHSDGLWNDEQCSKHFPAVCKKKQY